MLQRQSAWTASDMLVGSDSGNTWNITANEAGDVNGSVQFTNVENLTGGGDTDDFVFSDAVGVSGFIDGGNGSDTLDYTFYTSVVTVDLFGGTATVTGGIVSIEHWIDENGNQQALTAGGPAIPASLLQPSLATATNDYVVRPRRSQAVEPVENTSWLCRRCRRTQCRSDQAVRPHLWT